ncbi:MAG TPA: hypothetical protein VGA10_08670, partial [Thermoanaerobaculia bacterium]
REMGGFSNFAVSFSIISILTGMFWIRTQIRRSTGELRRMAARQRHDADCCAVDGGDCVGISWEGGGGRGRPLG